MRHRYTVALALGALLLAGVVAAGPLTIDADHGLTEDPKKAAWQTDGYAETELASPAMSIAVASEHDQCDVDGFRSDLRNDYLCVTYEEEIDRTLRFYIPDEYWTPYLRQGVEPLKGNVSATYEPVEDASYTAVTVRLEEPGTYVWPVTKEASFFAERKKATLERIETLTGVGVPSTDEWQYIESEQLGGNQTAYQVQAPNGTDALVLEYETAPGEWTTVPDAEQEYAPVYYQTKRGVDDRVWVFSSVSDPPQVRYKTEAGSVDQITAAVREIGQIPSRLEDILGIDIPFIGGG